MRISDWSSDVCSSDLGQSPGVLIIACSDSRVDPALIFDTNPGEIFVVRNVAALVPPFETTPGRHGVSAALEFAVQVLKVPEIVVMGHGRCGGCSAALTQELKNAAPGEGGFIAHWIRSEEHTSELQSLMRISYAVFCLKKKTYTRDR